MYIKIALPPKGARRNHETFHTYRTPQSVLSDSYIGYLKVSSKVRRYEGSYLLSWLTAIRNPGWKKRSSLQCTKDNIIDTVGNALYFEEYPVQHFIFRLLSQYWT